MFRSALPAGLVLTLAVSCGPRAVVPAIEPTTATRSATFSLGGQFNIPALTRFPPAGGPRFGGISGLAAAAAAGEFLGISDDHENPRVYRLRTTGSGSGFRVSAVDYISLQLPSSGAFHLDPESIAVAPNGNLLIVSEGMGSAEPRVPPAVLEFAPNGTFIGSLPVRDRFVPNPTGPLVKGVRGNIGFESITITPAGRLFVGTESAIVQDGELTTFEQGAPARIIEYVATSGGYETAREFGYMVEPVHRPPFDAGLAVNGLVELLALDEETLLALERSFVTEAANTGRNMNRIRLFRIDLRRATDVSRLDSLQDRSSFTPVRKVQLLDLSEVPGLSPELAPSLDNFEAIVFAPALPDGRAGLILASDDNFNPSQRTWFLLFAVDELSRPVRIQ
jgi:hypothetical protein